MTLRTMSQAQGLCPLWPRGHWLPGPHFPFAVCRAGARLELNFPENLSMGPIPARSPKEDARRGPGKSNFRVV